ncbi:hypothetical protein AX16_009364 [Volvariella volvacea WC 439]|nr:hypothetical protein AX16_009364 [Volvariella volvacea WC 439]
MPTPELWKRVPMPIIMLPSGGVHTGIILSATAAAAVEEGLISACICHPLSSPRGQWDSHLGQHLHH